jgi:hypothetical protein
MSAPNDEAPAVAAAGAPGNTQHAPCGTASFCSKSAPAVRITEVEQLDKRFDSLRARAALRGWQLWRTTPADGDPRYFATRWGMTRALGSPAEVDAFLCQVGA